jgi:cellulose biosynthesis protein BcsQ
LVIDSEQQCAAARYALARLLANDAIIDAFDLVIIDTLPRLTMATITALAAGTHFIVPTILDQPSTENIGSFLSQVKTLFLRDLNPHIKCAGIAGTMTATQGDLNNTEAVAATEMMKHAAANWGPEISFIARTVPDIARFHADTGKTIAYLDRSSANATTRRIIDELGSQCSKVLGL